jgi:hypothetical protein
MVMDAIPSANKVKSGKENANGIAVRRHITKLFAQSTNATNTGISLGISDRTVWLKGFLYCGIAIYRTLKKRQQARARKFY